MKSLFIVTGPSGAGKTTAKDALSGDNAQYLVLDSDVLWDDDLYGDSSTHSGYFGRWLKVCAEINDSSDKPVMLFGAGFNPANVKNLEEAKLFDTIHYLALVSDPQSLADRLQARPDHDYDKAYEQEHAEYNQWFIDQAALPNSPITIFTTSDTEISDTVQAVHEWVEKSTQPPAGAEFVLRTHNHSGVQDDTVTSLEEAARRLQEIQNAETIDGAQVHVSLNGKPIGAYSFDLTTGGYTKSDSWGPSSPVPRRNTTVSSERQQEQGASASNFP